MQNTQNTQNVKNVLITGADGIFGFKMIQQIIEKRLGQDIDKIICIGRVGSNAFFIPDGEKKWIEANLDEVDLDWWKDLQEAENIDTFMYLESSENSNRYIPDNILIEQFKASDSTFIEFLKWYPIGTETPLLNVMYLSTDKLYFEDKFPNTDNNLLVPIPIESDTLDDYMIKTYATNKINTEIALMGLTSILLRIIRPFSIVWDEQNAQWPLSRLILEAMSGVDLDIYQKGDKGLVFTHADDLIDFILSVRLFDNNVSVDIESIQNIAILNFCRVWNYLPEEYLVEKIHTKTKSESGINRYTDVNNFPYVIKTPQIRKMIKVGIPRIPIELIIEGIQKDMDPTDEYKPLLVTFTGYIGNNILIVTGTSEPLSSIIVQTDDGSSYVTISDQDGNWNIESEEPVIYEDVMTGITYATSKEGIQYDTFLFEVEPIPTD